MLKGLWFAATLILVGARGSSASPPALAITHVSLVDGTGAPLQRDMTILTRGARITAVGPAVATLAPRGARVIDGSGRYLIPGLWDMHVHLTVAGRMSVPLFPVNGVTGVRDMGGDLAVIDGLRAEIEGGTLLGPRIYRAGPFLDGPKKNALYRVTLRSADDARHAVDSLKQLGVDFIKVHSRVPRDAYFAVLAEARARGLRVAGHLPRGISPSEAALAGQASIEHTESLLEGVHFADSTSQHHTSREDFALLSGSAADSLFAVFKRNGTSIDPTLIEYSVFAHIGDALVTKDARLRYASPELRAYWNRFFPLDTAETIAATGGRREYLRRFMGLVYAMHNAGVPILTGTDVGASYIYPGFSLHDELALLVEAGIPPADVLEAATSGAASFLGVSDSVGTVQVGKLADLVLIDANPLVDIRNTQLIRTVIVNGRVLDAEDRRRILAGTIRAVSAGKGIAERPSVLTQTYPQRGRASVNASLASDLSPSSRRRMRWDCSSDCRSE
jgi:imidazolonepropionase-like amidohydrolase